MHSCRVLLCDRQIVAEGVRCLLQEDFSIEVVHSPTEALLLAHETDFDILLIEPSMPKAFDVVLKLRAQKPRLKVMFLTFQEDKATLLLAMRSGVKGMVLKIETVEALKQAIRAVMEGKLYVTPALEHNLPWALAGRPLRLDDAYLGLTERQFQVLQLVVTGRTLREIGDCLGISAKTAEFHKAGLMQGLGVKSSAELIRFAFDHKLAWTAN